MATANLKVTGMTCAHCMRAVTEALERVDGVSAARVDLEGGRAVVEYDEGRTGTRELVGAVLDQGYSAEEAG